MPERVQITVKGSEVRKGDEFLGSPVQEVLHKTKYAYITTLRTVKAQVALDDTVTVVRTQQTKAEKLADQLDYVVRDIRSAVQSKSRAVDAAVEAFSKAKQYSAESQWSYLSAYANAVCEQELWARVEHTQEVRWNRFAEEQANLPAEERTLGNDTLAWMWVETVVIVADELTSDMLNDRFRGSSTSWTSNGMNHEMRGVVSRFLTGYQVSGARHLLEKRKEV